MDKDNSSHIIDWNGVCLSYLYVLPRSQNVDVSYRNKELLYSVFVVAG
jgi:hypothetical protein